MWYDEIPGIAGLPARERERIGQAAEERLSHLGRRGRYVRGQKAAWSGPVKLLLFCALIVFAVHFVVGRPLVTAIVAAALSALLYFGARASTPDDEKLYRDALRLELLDENLRPSACVMCDCDLTGVKGATCPECGARFVCDDERI